MVAKRPLPRWTDGIKTVQPVRHLLLFTLRPFEFDLVAGCARDLRFQPSGKVHSHVDAPHARLGLGNGDRLDLFDQSVRLDLLRGELERGFKSRDRFPSGFVHRRFTPIRDLFGGIVSFAAKMHEVPNADGGVGARMPSPRGVGADEEGLAAGQFDVSLRDHNRAGRFVSGSVRRKDRPGKAKPDPEHVLAGTELTGDVVSDIAGTLRVIGGTWS